MHSSYFHFKRTYTHRHPAQVWSQNAYISTLIITWMNTIRYFIIYEWISKVLNSFGKFLCEHFSAVICYTNSVCCVCVFFVRIHYAFAAAAAVVLFVRCDTAVAAIEYTINRQSYWKNSFIHYSHRHSNFHKCFGMLEERNAQNMFLINGSPFL